MQLRRERMPLDLARWPGPPCPLLPRTEEGYRVQQSSIAVITK